MSTAEATATTFPETIKTLGEQIVNMKVLDVLSLTKYLKEVHGLEAAAAAPVMSMQAGPAAEAAPVQTEFDVVLESFGEKKLDVIKVVRAATALSLPDSKKLVEEAPKAIKTSVSKEDAEKLKKELEAAGGKVSIK